MLCTGKVYYTLKEERKKRQLDGKVALCRIEQLFPFPYEEVAKDLAAYPETTEIFWAQEEHWNHVMIFRLIFHFDLY